MAQQDSLWAAKALRSERWLAESFISGLKRVLGPWLSAQLPQNQVPRMLSGLLKVLAYWVHTQARALKAFQQGKFTFAL